MTICSKIFCFRLLPFACLGLFLSLCGCKTIETKTEILRDSVQVFRTIERRDTLYKIEPDTAAARALLKCDSVGNVLLSELNAANGTRLRLIADLQRLQDGAAQLDVICGEDTLLVQVEQLKETIRELQQKERERLVYIDRVPPFFKWCTTFFFFLVVFDLAVVVLWLWIRF